MTTRKTKLNTELQAGFEQINANFKVVGEQIKSLEKKIDANHTETVDFFVAMKKDFDRLDDKVSAIDDRLASVEILSAKNEHHFHELDLNMNKRFSDMDKRFSDVDKRFSDMDKRFDHLEATVFPKAARRLSLAV